ncbi:uncharacterized protein LOC133188835 [Saccostrea echinata]|uniref:uncharacterized protein LOC133188835 n=1 Tax=Saccostrea echinata TaxID=191078 RepID=UPI002A837C32|nr:uncharacterized protein LOC133188835 [Saccostrea echinata]
MKESGTVLYKRIPKHLVILLAIHVVGVSLKCTNDEFRYVEECPVTEEQRIQASKAMLCSTTTINGSPNPYHCVIDPSVSKLIEVCAEPVQVIGRFCAEYNPFGKRIQSNTRASCSDHNNSCPPSYTSTDAYKYPDCYALVLKNISTTEKLKTLNKPYVIITNERIQFSVTYKFIITVVVCFTSFSVALCAGVMLKRTRNS